MMAWQGMSEMIPKLGSCISLYFLGRQPYNRKKKCNDDTSATMNWCNDSIIQMLPFLIPTTSLRIEDRCGLLLVFCERSASQCGKGHESEVEQREQGVAFLGQTLCKYHYSSAVTACTFEVCVVVRMLAIVTF
jgi:hypothetical protein